MKTLSFVLSMAVTAVTLMTARLSAQDEPKPPQPPAVNREALREQLRNMTPEQRQARIRELRERQTGTNRVDIEKRRQEFQKLQEELKGLPPEERQKKMREWRQKQGLAQPGFRTIDADQAKTKRQELKGRIDQQLTELRKKKADGTINEQEARRLERMEIIAGRLDQAPSRADPGALPPPAKPAKPGSP